MSSSPTSRFLESLRRRRGRLRRARERLSAQNSISLHLASAETVGEAGSQVLRVIGETLGWNLGVLWTLDPLTDLLRPVEIWKDEGIESDLFEKATLEMTFPSGVGLPGRVLESRVPCWIQDVQTDSNYPRSSHAIEQGLRAAFAFPILLAGRVVGVIEFYCRSASRPDQELLEMMASVGTQMGLFMQRLQTQEDLRASAESHRAVLESVSDAIFTIDGSSVILSANSAVETMFGYEVEELLGKSLTLLMPERHRRAHRQGIERYLATGRRSFPWHEVELEGLRRNGEEFPIALSFGEFVRDQKHFFTGVVRDITGRRRADRERQELHEAIERERTRLKEILFTVPGVVWEAWGRPDQGDQRIDFVSEHVETMLGYRVEEWLARPNFWLTIVHPDDRERAAREASEIFRNGHGTSEFRWLRKDGQPIWVESQSVVIRDHAGNPIGMRGMTMDITDRKKAEAMQEFLGEATALLTSSLEPEKTLAVLAKLAVPRLADWCAIDLLDDRGELRRLAVEHEDPEKIDLARKLEQRYPPRRESGEEIAGVVDSGESLLLPEIPHEMLRRTAVDEEHLELLQSLGLRSAMIVPLTAHDQTFGAITFVTSESGEPYDEGDLGFAEELARRAALAIDNSRLYREAQLASQARDEFLATLSHELRTPMTAILGWSRMLSLGGLDEETRHDAVETILRSSESQARLIDDVLDVSRIITGKMRLHLEKTDLQSLLGDSARSIEPTAEAKGISFRLALEPVPTILADPARLNQVVWNLLSNAVKFTPKGGWVELRLHPVESNVRIEVEDSGEGIDPEFLAHMFERFRQAEGSTRRIHGGLGLGLSIVRHLTEMHGGEVSAVSKGKNQGTIFIVDLPIAAVASKGEPVRHAEHVAREPELGGELPDLRGRVILVVDDDADARRLVRAVLERCGAEVETSGSVSEAMDTLRSREFDLVISDIGMPDQDGFDLSRQIQTGFDGDGIQMPLIALTAYGRNQDRERILAAGFDAYLRKPTDPVELAETVSAILAKDT